LSVEAGKRTLLTGGAGFIGARLLRRLLAEGHEVEGIVRPQSDRWRLQDLEGEVAMHEVDLRDFEAVCKAVEVAKPDWIFHCAAHGAYSWQDDARSIFESNVIGTSNLANACVNRGFEAFVQAGSSSEYGLKDHAPTEQELPEPNSDYAVAKVAATMLCASLAARSGLRIATLRLYSAYGPWEDPRRLIPALVVHGMRGELPPLVSPDTARDFVHVDDVVEAFLLAARFDAARVDGVYNVGSGRQTTLRELVEATQSVFDMSAQPQWATHEARSWDTDVWVANPARIEGELGWRASRSIESGLRDMARWLDANPSVAARYRASHERRERGQAGVAVKR
jgi:UDP-glucose 4-epimerase